MGKIATKSLLFIFWCCLVALGVWQLFRWDYKTTLIKDILDNQNLPAISVNSSNQLADLKYRKVVLRGNFIKGKTIYYYALKSNTPGYETITIFKLSDSVDYILIGRGWSKKRLEQLASNDDRPITISGYVVDLPKKNIFSPQNDLKSDTWFGFLLSEIERHIGIENIVPLMVNLDTEEYLIGEKDRLHTKSIPNNHLGYAITWFTLAIILIIMHLLRSRQIKKIVEFY